VYPVDEWVPRYIKHLEQLAGKFQADFTEAGIEFQNYCFVPASVYPSGLVPYRQIVGIDAQGTPPEVYTSAGEILFVSAVQKEQLQQTAERNSIPTISPFDVWRRILEPCSNTDFSAEHRRKTIDELSQVGLSGESVMKIRSRVDGPLNFVNYHFLRIWWLFDLFDVLDVMQAVMEPVEYRDFYAEAMQIADLGRRHDPVQRSWPAAEKPTPDF
jgi:hypothetical protein